MKSVEINIYEKIESVKIYSGNTLTEIKEKVINFLNSIINVEVLYSNNNYYYNHNNWHNFTNVKKEIVDCKTIEDLKKMLKEKYDLIFEVKIEDMRNNINE